MLSAPQEALRQLCIQDPWQIFAPHFFLIDQELSAFGIVIGHLPAYIFLCAKHLVGNFI
jgi:hypothetical protein